MGHKRRGRFHFIFQYIGRSICVFLATFIAADQKWFIDVRSRQYCVRLPEWNPVHTKEIAAPVKPVVLTYNHPAIIAVYPHFLRGLYFLFLARSHSRFGNLDGSGVLRRGLFLLFGTHRHSRYSDLDGSGVETISDLRRGPAQPGISTQTVLRDVEEGLRNRGWNDRIGLTLRGGNRGLVGQDFHQHAPPSAPA